MNIWKRFSLLVISMLLVTILAACGGGGSSADSAGSTPTAAAPTSAPTTAAPTSTPTTGGSQGTTGGCTTAASCQKAVITITPNKVKAGGKVKVTVTGWVANAKADVQAAVQNGVTDVVTVTSDAQGNFTVVLTALPVLETLQADIHVTWEDAPDVSKDLTVVGGLTVSP